jgi:hypothetical protein
LLKDEPLIVEAVSVVSNPKFKGWDLGAIVDLRVKIDGFILGVRYLLHAITLAKTSSLPKPRADFVRAPQTRLSVLHNFKDQNLRSQKTKSQNIENKGLISKIFVFNYLAFSKAGELITTSKFSFWCSYIQLSKLGGGTWQWVEDLYVVCF